MNNLEVKDIKEILGFIDLKGINSFKNLVKSSLEEVKDRECSLGTRVPWIEYIIKYPEFFRAYMEK